MKNSSLYILLLINLLACGDDFDAVRSLREVNIEVKSLDDFELKDLAFDAPVELSEDLVVTVPNDLGAAGSVTVLVRPKESYSQDDLFAREDEAEPNNSADSAQVLPAGTIQVDGAAAENDSGTTVAGNPVKDVFALNFTATTDQLAVLSPDAELSLTDFELSVFDATGAVLLGDSDSDEGFDEAFEMVKFSVIATQDRYFGVDVEDSFAASSANNYFLSHFRLETESEDNSSPGNAESLKIAATTFRAIEGDASSGDAFTNVSIDGSPLSIEDFYSFTLDRTAPVNVLLKMTTVLNGTQDLDLYVVRGDNGELLGSSTTDQTSSTTLNMESTRVVVPANVTIYVFVDAFQGSSNYQLAAQPISENFSAKPTLLLGRMRGPGLPPLMDLTDECTNGVEDLDCESTAESIFRKFTEYTSALNKLFGLDAFSLVMPHNGVHFPLNANDQLPAGDYELKFAGYYENENVTLPVDHTLASGVKLLIKKDRDPSFGVLDMNLYLVGDTVIESAAAEGVNGERKLDTVLNGVDTIFQQVGIELGQVRKIAIDGASGNTLARDLDINSQEAIATLFSHIERRDGAINVFLIENFDPEVILGVSLGISGLPVVDGFPTSGAIFAILEPLADQSAIELNLLTTTIAHEIGHYLGLYHPTEFNGAVFDPLTDTAQCDSSMDDNANNVLDFDECRGDGDAFNLMFWSSPISESDLSDLTDFTLSSQQGFVMNTNHYIR